MKTSDISKQNALEKIERLMHRFEEQKHSYLQPTYNETQTRRDFIDPFFKALGWDVDNENNYAESYREVIHEFRQKDGKNNRAPDYAFRLHGGKQLFFIEAKKPSVLIKDSSEPAYQVRRYGWSAKLPISIVTDFQEFAVYDCTKKPMISDKPSTARIKYLTYSNYLQDFDFLWDTFSRERVLQGSFDRFIQNDKLKKGTSTLDAEFLQSLDSWRIQLATSICKNNKLLNEDEINFVVQHTIDRIIFLRIAEDRSIEPYGNLQNCIREGNLYHHLFQLFKEADDKYNSGLFDFNKDKLSSLIEIENKVLKTIISDLYYPNPYAFSVMPVEILGTAYEQFLGKQITIDTGHRAKIEEKPEVRKAGGVYYTPQHIVDYIVKNTVGKLIEGKTPKEIEHLKILDPACGSGSFLLGAYDYLLNYHKGFYTKNGTLSKGSKKDTLTPEGNLTTNEKKRILLNNIYGVDIDANAVEVTKLSLLIKCMEGETEASIANQMSLFHDRVLPTLDNNIKSGNSLIDTDFYDHGLGSGNEKKIKPFNWQKNFPEIFKQGGFDVVIGNPPYVNVKEIDIISQKYFTSQYSCAKGQTDLYALFIEKSLTLLNKQALLSFIIPDSLIDRSNYSLLRKYILTNSYLYELVSMNKVFDNVNVGSLIFFTSKKKVSKNLKIVKSKDLTTFILNQNKSIEVEPEQILKNEHYNFAFIDPIKQSILYKIYNGKKKLSDYCTFGRGEEISKKADFISNDSKKGLPFITGDNIQRYSPIKPTLFIPKVEVKKSIEKLYGKKIVVRQVGNNINATWDDIGCITPQSVYTINPENKIMNLFFMGLLNSSLFDFIYKTKYKSKEIFPRILLENLKDLPVIELNKAIPPEIVTNVTTLLKLNQELKLENLPSKIEGIKQHIDHTEEKLNQLVYQLYNLTEEEIKTIEESFKD